MQKSTAASGKYLNIGNEGFRSIRNSEYVDKTGLICFMNKCLDTPQKLICVSRPRRFGKSFATKMLCAYYSKGCDSRELFEDLQIAKDPAFAENLNQYEVLYLDITLFLSTLKQDDMLVERMEQEIINDLGKVYPEVGKEQHLVDALCAFHERTEEKMILIIDEWDVLIRDAAANSKVQKEYINFLRGMFKGTEPTRYIQLAYLTGILPIKKEKTQSALNNFDEFTMVSPSILAQYIGFTEAEVQKLSDKYHQDFDKVKKWYDGYLLKDYQVYNPRAVVSVMLKGEYKSYWSETASYEAIVPFINMNYDGLKTAIIEMLSGSSVKVNTATFKNDTVNIQSKDDVLTYMIHLGYLGYDQTEKIAFVPNEEIRQELTNAVKSKSWNEMLMFQQESETLLDATLDMDNETVAAQIEKIHNEYASVIRYHDENSLSSVLAIAYLGTMQYYFKPVREFPTGRGFADFIFIPKPEYKSAYPALVVELKWNQKVQTAIQQIKDRKYPSSISDYTGDILLVRINYDKKSKKHQCIIEKV